MRKFIYFLQDSPSYPNEIFASSKEEVRNLILESIGPDNEGSIIGIYSAEEIQKKQSQGAGAIYSDASEYGNSKDFFNDVIKAGKIVGQSIEQEENNVQVDELPKLPKTENTNISNKTAIHDVKYFEEGGFQFKLENGKVYKKKWINISSSESSDEYRIINSVTKKPIKSDKYEIEKLDWVEL